MDFHTGRHIGKCAGGSKLTLGLLRRVAYIALLALAGCGGGGGGGGHGGGGGGGGGGGAPNVSVTVAAANNQSLVAPGAVLQISASVVNATNQRVTWSLAGTTCPANCGTLNSTIGNPVTFSAPATVTAEFVVTIIATSVQDQRASASVMLIVPTSVCPSGNEATLQGPYAFLLRGAGPNGTLAAVGSFTADGKGAITGGLEDRTPVAGSPVAVSVLPTGSKYTLGADGRGCVSLATSDGAIAQYRIAVGLASVVAKGRMIEFDDATGTGTRMEGFLARQDATAFSVSSVQGNYVLGLVGEDVANKRIASAGVFGASAGVLSNGTLDVNDAGTLAATVTGISGSYGVSATGRGVASWTIGSTVTNVVLYVVSPDQLLALTTDPVEAGHPLLSGELLRQTASGFDSRSLNANAVAWLTGFDSASNQTAATIGLVSPDGNGAFTFVFDINQGGTVATLQTLAGAYSVAASGRVTTSVSNGSNAPVLYLTGANIGFVLGTDAIVSFGHLEQQTAPAPITNTTLSGAYFYGSEGARPASRLIAGGSMSFDGSLARGTEDESTPAGLVPSVNFGPAPYSFSGASAVPGRGALDPYGHQLAYVISPGKLVYLNTPALRPRIVVVEK